LVIDCPADYLRATNLEVVFDDPSSDRGARISLTLWAAWLNAMAALLVTLAALMMFPSGRLRLARSGGPVDEDGLAARRACESRSIAVGDPSHRN
jgi:hypothetical protein